MPKIIFIGAGSFKFTRKLVRDLLTFPLLEESEIALIDINEQRLGSARRACEKIIAMGGLSGHRHGDDRPPQSPQRR